MFSLVRSLLALLVIAGLGRLGERSIPVRFAARAQQVNPNNYTIINGQIFTPGLAIVDAPQPNTPLGGDFLQVALDVSYDGAIGLPPYNQGANTKIYNITIFLFSNDNKNNFTISNGTAGARNASLGDIMEQEPGSTVKHVNWNWPDCLVGNGVSNNGNSSNARGAYNISMHQSFRLNGSDYYTIFNLPIQVTNAIPDSSTRPTCDSLNNKLLPADQMNSTGIPTVLPYSVPKNQPKNQGAAAALRPQSTALALGLFMVGLVVTI